MFSIRVARDPRVDGDDDDGDDDDDPIEQLQWFDRDEIVIGRVPQCDLVLDDITVSKRHARIVVKDGKYILVDLKSTNGTFVNERRMSSPLVIKIERDRIRIGTYELTLAETTNPGIRPALPVRPRRRSDAPRTSRDEPTMLIGAPLRVPPGPPVSDAERALIEMIHEAPDDDGPREIYADWLIERGDPRGEFINLQCSGPGVSARSNVASAQAEARSRRLQRARKLLQAHGADWLAPFQLSRRDDYEVRDGYAAVELYHLYRNAEGLRPQLERGFLKYPLCVAARQVTADSTLFRLSPTLYETGARIWAGTSTLIYRGRVRGPGEPERSPRRRIVIRCSTLAAHLPEINKREHVHQREALALGFVDTWKLASQVDDPHIARTLGLAYWGLSGDVALITEWVDGLDVGTLLDRVHQGAPAFTPPVVAGLLGQVCLAMDRTHRTADRHGQPTEPHYKLLTPDHVMVSRGGQVKQTNVTMFSSHMRALTSRTRQWRSGHAWRGSYLAPEIHGIAGANWQSDLFTWGAVARGLLGEAPGHQGDGRIPRRLGEIIDRAVAAECRDRYRSALEMHDDLQTAIAREGWDSSPEAIATALFPDR